MPQQISDTPAPADSRRNIGRWMVLMRAISGLVMFVFVTMHLLNHVMLLISLPRAEEARAWLAAPWRTWPGAVLLYGALATHLMLTLQALYRRRTLVIPPGELLRLILGLLIPYFLAEHVISVRLNDLLYGIHLNYTDVVRGMWITTPVLGVQQAVALVVVWTHACIGVTFLLRFRPGWRTVAPLFLGAAVLLPVLALLGFAMAGRTLSDRHVFPTDAAILYAPLMEEMSATARVPNGVPPKADRDMMMTSIISGFRAGYITLIALILLARQGRTFYERSHAVTISYGNGRRVRMQPGSSVLEASRANGIPHYAVCGGNGRCSTCRVRIIRSEGPLPPRTTTENMTLRRIHADEDVRLACQLRPTHDLDVMQLLTPPPDVLSINDIEHPPAPRERTVAVLFCDLRGFTSFSESRLPYDVVFVLNRYFAIVGDAVVESGGRIDKFIGDGAMALFGIDQNPADACRAALSAARGIVAGIDRLNAELSEEIGATLRVAIGLHFGPAVVGVMGFNVAMAETAVGDTVNVASRLETIAKEENAVLAVSEEVLTKADAVIGATALRKFTIRGRAKPIRVGLFSDPLPSVEPPK
ncbi:MAG TPA: adenylate/guanylate cyclase domain-containing protein [Paenirhodobacter sp.]